MREFFPFLDLKGVHRSTLSKDFTSALAVTFMAVPQGVAYAVIAGLPPAMGLYAATLPTIVGALMRSSRHVMTGPTNAVSLLVAGGVAAMLDADPLQIGITLALLVGLIQFLAGILRLGVLIDYISNPVLLGYITGAGLLIGVGQLPNVTATPGTQGWIGECIWFWLEGLGATSFLTLVMALGTAALILILRRVNKKIPSAIVALALATVVSLVFSLQEQGLKTVFDLAPVPNGLPALTLPDVALFATLLPLAIACAVLSLVESSAVARAIAAETGQRLNTSVEFVGQGLANISGAFVGAYPTSGSLGRSALNHQNGAESRCSGVIAGVLMLLVLLVFGPVVNHTPIAALAGLLLVVAVDLMNMDKIRLTLKSNWADKISFLATFLGTWILSLEQAIYLGVFISLVFFFRKARVVNVRQLSITQNDGVSELKPSDASIGVTSHIRILHLEGHLFFGAAGRLQLALDRAVEADQVQVLILRLRKAQGMDVTIAASLIAGAQRLHARGKHLVLTGVSQEVKQLLVQLDALAFIGEDNVFDAQPQWLEAFQAALKRATNLVSSVSTELNT